jgi:hypothetical protein
MDRPDSTADKLLLVVGRDQKTRLHTPICQPRGDLPTCPAKNDPAFCLRRPPLRPAP